MKHQVKEKDTRRNLEDEALTAWLHDVIYTYNGTTQLEFNGTPAVGLSEVFMK